MPIGKLFSPSKPKASNLNAQGGANNKKNPKLQQGSGGKPKVPAGGAPGVKKKLTIQDLKRDTLTSVKENIAKLLKDGGKFKAMYVQEVAEAQEERLQKVEKDLKALKAKKQNVSEKVKNNLEKEINNNNKAIEETTNQITALNAKIDQANDDLKLLQDAINHYENQAPKSLNGFEAAKKTKLTKLLTNGTREDLSDLKEILALLNIKCEDLVEQLKDNYVNLTDAKKAHFALKASNCFLYQQINNAQKSGKLLNELREEFILSQNTKPLKVDVEGTRSGNNKEVLNQNMTRLETISKLWSQATQDIKHITKIISAIKTTYLPAINDTHTIPESQDTLKDKLNFVNFLYIFLDDVKTNKKTPIGRVNTHNDQNLFQINHPNKELRDVGKKIWNKLLEAKNANTDEAAKNFSDFLQDLLANPDTIRDLLGDAALVHLNQEKSKNNFNGLIKTKTVASNFNKRQEEFQKTPIDPNRLAEYMVLRAVQTSVPTAEEIAAKIQNLKNNPPQNVVAQATADLKASDMQGAINADIQAKQAKFHTKIQSAFRVYQDAALTHDKKIEQILALIGDHGAQIAAYRQFNSNQKKRPITNIASNDNLINTIAQAAPNNDNDLHIKLFALATKIVHQKNNNHGRVNASLNNLQAAINENYATHLNECATFLNDLKENYNELIGENNRNAVKDWIEAINLKANDYTSTLLKDFVQNLENQIKAIGNKQPFVVNTSKAAFKSLVDPYLANPLPLKAFIDSNILRAVLENNGDPQLVNMVLADDEPALAAELILSSQKLIRTFFQNYFEVENINGDDAKTDAINTIRTALLANLTETSAAHYDASERLKFAYNMQQCFNKVKTEANWFANKDNWNNALFNVLNDPKHPLNKHGNELREYIFGIIDGNEANKKDQIIQVLQESLTDSRDLAILTGNPVALKAAYDEDNFIDLEIQNNNVNQSISDLFNNAGNDANNLLAWHIAGIAKQVKVEAKIEALPAAQLTAYGKIETAVAEANTAIGQKIANEFKAINKFDFKHLMELHLKPENKVQPDDVLRIFTELKNKIGTTKRELEDVAQNAHAHYEAVRNQPNPQVAREAKIKFILLHQINDQAEQFENAKNLPAYGYLQVADALLKQDALLRLTDGKNGLRRNPSIIALTGPERNAQALIHGNQYINQYPEEVLRFLNANPKYIIKDHRVQNPIKIIAQTPAALHDNIIATILNAEFKGKNEVERLDIVLELQKQAIEAYLTKIGKDENLAPIMENELINAFKFKLQNDLEEMQNDILSENEAHLDAEKFEEIEKAVNATSNSALELLKPYTTHNSMNDMMEVNEKHIKETYTLKQSIISQFEEYTPTTSFYEFDETVNTLESVLDNFSFPTEDTGTTKVFDDVLQSFEALKDEIKELETQSAQIDDEIKVNNKLIAASDTAIDKLSQESNTAIIKQNNDIKDLLLISRTSMGITDAQNAFAEINNISKKLQMELRRLNQNNPQIEEAKQNAYNEFNDEKNKLKNAIKKTITTAQYHTAIDAAIDEAFTVTGGPANPADPAGPANPVGGNFALNINIKDLNAFQSQLDQNLVDVLMQNPNMMKILTEESLYQAPEALNHFLWNTNEPQLMEILEEIKNEKSNPAYILPRLAYVKMQLDAKQNPPVDTAAKYQETADSFEKQIESHYAMISSLKTKISELNAEKNRLEELKTKKENILSAKESIEGAQKVYKDKAGEVIEKHLGEAELEDASLFDKLFLTQAKIEEKITNEKDPKNIKTLHEDQQKVHNALVLESASYVKSTIQSNIIEMEDGSKISTNDKPLLAAQQKLARCLDQVVEALNMMNTGELDKTQGELKKLIHNEIVTTLNGEAKNVRDGIDVINAIISKKIPGFDSGHIQTIKTHLTSLDKHIQSLAKTLQKPFNKNQDLLKYQIKETSAVIIKQLNAIDEDIAAIQKADQKTINQIDANATKILKASRWNLSKILGKLTMGLGLTATALSAFIMTVIGVSADFGAGIFAISAGIFLIGKSFSWYGNRVSKLTNDFGNNKETIANTSKMISNLSEIKKSEFEAIQKTISKNLVLNAKKYDAMFGVDTGSLNLILNNSPYNVAESIMKEPTESINYLKRSLAHYYEETDQLANDEFSNLTKLITKHNSIYVGNKEALNEALQKDLQVLQVVNLCLAIADEKTLNAWKKDKQFISLLNEAVNLKLSTSKYLIEASIEEHKYLQQTLKSKLQEMKFPKK